MSEPRHTLIIRPGVAFDGPCLDGHLTLENGHEFHIKRDEREQIIAWAQQTIAAHDAVSRQPEEETLILDHAGEIVRDEHSVRVEQPTAASVGRGINSKGRTA